MRRGIAPSALLWLLVGTAYFMVPLAATAEFSLKGSGEGYGFTAYRTILEDPQFKETIWLSFKLAVETAIVSLLLFVPTVYWVHLKLPRLRPVIAFLSILPFVVPPIVLVVGLADVYRSAVDTTYFGIPQILVAGYVVLSFPFVFWPLDAGFRAIDVHTLTEASQNLGAGWRTTLTRVILPNVRIAALSGALLTLAIVMGEFTMAQILLYFTFPIYINYIAETTAYPAAALTIISFGITWAALLLILIAGRGAGTQQQVQTRGAG